MNTFGIEQSVSSWYGALLMGLIVGMSIYVTALVVIRSLFFRSIRADSRQLLKGAVQAVTDNDAKSLAELKGNRPTDSPLRILIQTGISNRHLPETELRELLSITQVRQKERLEKGLSSFGTMASIGPFLGLLATVMGIIESFHNLSQTGAAGPSVVASGVAAALWGTAAGLAVAIPSVVAYNVFNKKARAFVNELEILARELVLNLKINKVMPQLREYKVKEA